MKNKEKEKITKEQLEHFYTNVLAPLGVTRVEWQHILESGVIPDLIASIRSRGYLVRSKIRIALGLDMWPEPTHFNVRVRVNRNLTLRESIALTRCETQPKNISDRSFLGPREEDVDATIFHFGKGRDMFHKEVLDELRAYGYRPALLEEILAVSAQCPHLQTKFPIAGVGCGDDAEHFWMIDCPAVMNGPAKRRVEGNFANHDILYDFYRVIAVRDPHIQPTKRLVFSNTTEEGEIKFVDSEYEAMKSVYRPVTAA